MAKKKGNNNMSDISKEDVIQDLIKCQIETKGKHSCRVISRDKYLEVSGLLAPQSKIRNFFGTYAELKRQAGLTENRSQRREDLNLSKHVSVDNLRELSDKRKDWGEKYIRSNSGRYKLIVGSSDLHDIEVDPFLLRVLIDTIFRSQPDIVSFAGDIFDLPEFSRFYKDPREWDQLKRLKFVHNEILAPIRDASPDSQIDLIEGNHERRLLKNIINNAPSVGTFLSDWLDITVEKALKLDEFEINYIAESDLTTWTKRDDKKELAKNFKIYFDCMLVHHYSTNGRNMGFPGFSGHNHKHELWNGYNPIFGPYEWHQIGCGHRRDARYTDGLQWHNGFILCHIDKKDKYVNFEYVPVTDHAVVGGKLYTRGKKEIVIPGRK